MSKFNIGDQVRVVNYGSLFTASKSVLNAWDIRKGDDQACDQEAAKIYEESDTHIVYDLSPYLIGQKGIITNVVGDENTAYTIHGIPGKTSWYADGQLELVYRPDYK
jgi:hypothetical protein